MQFCIKANIILQQYKIQEFRPHQLKGTRGPVLQGCTIVAVQKYF